MFKRVCATSDIAVGEVKPFDVGGHMISIANVDGKFYAIDDTCTHEQCSLGEGELDERAVVCPCHGAMFDVADGKVLALPAVKDLGSYEVKIEDDNVLVEL